MTWGAADDFAVQAMCRGGLLYGFQVLTQLRQWC